LFIVVRASGKEGETKNKNIVTTKPSCHSEAVGRRISLWRSFASLLRRSKEILHVATLVQNDMFEQFITSQKKEIPANYGR
jgi:hypothetical protein